MAANESKFKDNKEALSFYFGAGDTHFTQGVAIFGGGSVFVGCFNSTLSSAAEIRSYFISDFVCWFWDFDLT